MERNLKICMAGFGAVGQRFCRLLQEKRPELLETYGFDVRLTGVCTRSRGTLVDPEGLDIDGVFAMEQAAHKFDHNHPGYRDCGALDMIRQSGADVFCELTTLSIDDGEPATQHIETALEHGMHVITANKGPVAYHSRRLRDKAAACGKLFLYETIVLDGTPIFNLVKDTLHGNKILGIRGILNGTSNFVLEQLEHGADYAAAIKEAQRIQLAEADPGMDVDGWDGAAKICAMANILMDAGLNPKQAEIESIRNITYEDIAEARKAGCRIKYICEAKYDEGGKVKLSVKPQRIAGEDVFYNVNGTSAAITLYTDLGGELSVIQTAPTILQTAYGIYSDLITLMKSINKS